MPSSSPPPLSTSSGSSAESAVEAFIARWKGKDGGERSNYQLFISELCDLIEVPRPDPSSSDSTDNAYIFERSVEMRGNVEAAASRFSADKSKRQDAAPTSYGYIDCYKRGCFVFETKQGVEKKDREALSDVGREREAKRRTGHGVRGKRRRRQIMGLGVEE